MTFSSLFLKIQSGIVSTVPITEELVNSDLQRIYVGQSKDNFSVVEKTHSVVDVCRSFGSFVKFIVNVSSLPEIVQISKRSRTESDSEQVNISNGSLPSKIKEKNSKDRLYNKRTDSFLAMGLSWKDPEKFGKPFIHDMCDVLWYIDGHHAALASRSCPVPSMFSSFVGFNKPERSKHRKRSISNLSRDKIDEFLSLLQDYITCS